MRRRNVELRVGMLVIVAIAVLAAWLLFLREFKFSTDVYEVTVDFTEAAGLKAGAGVAIRGLDRGKVAQVELLKDRVRVILEIEEGVDLPADSRFALQTDLFDPTSIRVVTGVSDRSLARNTVHQGDEGMDLSGVMSRGADLVESLATLSARFDSLTANGRLERLGDDLEGGVRELRVWTQESRTQTRELIRRVDRLTAKLEGFVDETRAPVRDTLSNLDRVAVRADTLTADLSELTRSLTRISRDLEAGEGSLGQALNSSALHDSMVVTVERLDSLIAEVMANPKKYISFSLF